jgi:hypothetical protein
VHKVDAKQNIRDLLCNCLSLRRFHLQRPELLGSEGIITCPSRNLVSSAVTPLLFNDDKTSNSFRVKSVSEDGVCLIWFA